MFFGISVFFVYYSVSFKCSSAFSAPSGTMPGSVLLACGLGNMRTALKVRAAPRYGIGLALVASPGGVCGHSPPFPVSAVVFQP